MYKNIKFRVILISVITGMLLIGVLSFLYLNSIGDIKNLIVEGKSITEILLNIDNINLDAKIAVIAIFSVFVIMSILIISVLSRFVICPKNKFIKGDERKELKDKLNEVSSRKNQIETILLHMTDGIIAFNMNGDIILINPAAKKFLSISPEDNTFEDIFGKFKLDINMEKVIYLETWTSTEQRIQVDDKFVKVLFAPFKNEDERPDGVIAVIQDITEHVKLDNMQKELVADVSHELKTPITSIMGYADTLLEGGYDEETQLKFLNVISAESRRMARLVTDLLTLSRYDNNRKKTKKESFDLGDLVKRCQEKLAIEIKKKQHIVNCFVTADVPLVYADKDDIERVVLNIMTNSIKYTQDGGEIKVYVGFVYNDAYIKIIDDGIGIPEEDLSRIFERFYRVDKARTREMGGTGLGLSIAKEILDKNGGSIDIKSKVGEGTEVVIRVPTKE
ncbi:MAG: cell wall metabolism sensor histidine kinase WalK [Clostridia bacterium]|jgi:two-component system sensor histidine kinase VicK|nr:cell wall metabolism sensor histidine kinase WalK [Clostridia bacterium]